MPNSSKVRLIMRVTDGSEETSTSSAKAFFPAFWISVPDLAGVGTVYVGDDDTRIAHTKTDSDRAADALTRSCDYSNGHLEDFPAGLLHKDG